MIPLATGSLESSLLVPPVSSTATQRPRKAKTFHTRSSFAPRKSSRSSCLHYSANSQSTQRCQSLITKERPHWSSDAPGPHTGGSLVEPKAKSRGSAGRRQRRTGLTGKPDRSDRWTGRTGGSRGRREGPKRRTRGGIARLASRLSKVRCSAVRPMEKSSSFQICPQGLCIDSRAL